MGERSYAKAICRIRCPGYSSDKLSCSGVLDVDEVVSVIRQHTHYRLKENRFPSTGSRHPISKALEVQRPIWGQSLKAFSMPDDQLIIACRAHIELEIPKAKAHCSLERHQRVLCASERPSTVSYGENGGIAMREECEVVSGQWRQAV
jgi:hypothetical protein